MQRKVLIVIQNKEIADLDLLLKVVYEVIGADKSLTKIVVNEGLKEKYESYQPDYTVMVGLLIPTWIFDEPFMTVEPPHKVTQKSLPVWAAKIAEAFFPKEVKPLTAVKKVESVQDSMDLCNLCMETGYAAFDTETCSDWGFKEGHVQWWRNDFRCTTLSISYQAGCSYVIPLQHPESTLTEAETANILSLVHKYIFANPKVQKIGHNVKYDMHVLKKCFNINLRGRIHDTMLLHHIFDETSRHGLKELVAMYLPEFIGYDDGVKDGNWHKVTLPTLIAYNGIDSDVTIRLFYHLYKEILVKEKDLRLYTLYRNLTVPLSNALFQTEHDGVLIDREYLQESIVKAELLLAKVEKKIGNYPVVTRYNSIVLQDCIDTTVADLKVKIEKAKIGGLTEKKYQEQLSNILAGVELPKSYLDFNVGSPKQLSELLYTDKGFKFEMPYNEYLDKEGGTGEEVLNLLKDKSGFVESVLTYRKIKKSLSTYLVAINELCDDKNTIHPSFKIHGTKTGRISAASPNTQNISVSSRILNPELKEVVEYIKHSFICPMYYTMVQLDFSQGELRLMAAFSKDEAMMQVYREDKDLHAVTAARLLGVTIEEFYKLPKDTQKLARYNAKAVNFGFIYLISPEGYIQFAKSTFGLDLSLKVAKQHQKAFFDTYPKISDYHKEYIAKAKKFGYVRTAFGRKRHTPDIHNSDGSKRSADERISVNSPIQGTLGELTTLGVVLLRQRLDSAVFIPNTVHDSIIMFVPDNILDEQIRIAVHTCENIPTKRLFGVELGIKMRVDVEVGQRWSDLKPYEIK